MKYHCKLFANDIEGEMEEFEDLMSKSYEGDGRVNVVMKETKLTEEGRYLVALHWLEDSDHLDDDEKATLDDIVTSGV